MICEVNEKLTLPREVVQLSKIGYATMYEDASPSLGRSYSFQRLVMPRCTKTHHPPAGRVARYERGGGACDCTEIRCVAS